LPDVRPHDHGADAGRRRRAYLPSVFSMIFVISTAALSAAVATVVAEIVTTTARAPVVAIRLDAQARSHEVVRPAPTSDQPTPISPALIAGSSAPHVPTLRTWSQPPSIAALSSDASLAASMSPWTTAAISLSSGRVSRRRRRGVAQSPRQTLRVSAEGLAGESETR